MFQDINSSFNGRKHTSKDTNEFLSFHRVLEGWLKPQAHPECVQQVIQTANKAKLVWSHRYNFFKGKIALYNSDEFGFVVGSAHNPTMIICMTTSGHEFMPLVAEHCLKDLSFNPTRMFGGLKDLTQKNEIEKIPKTVIKLEFIGYIQ